MEERHPEKNQNAKNTGGKMVAVMFDDIEAAEAASSDLEANGFDRKKIGVAYPKDRQQHTSPPPDKDAPEKRGVLFAGAPTAGFPGWTMGMAPWTFAGVGPMVVIGSLSLARQDDGPDDLRGLIMSLGLHEDVYGELEQGFQRGRILMTVDPEGRDAIASSILARNGGHSLHRD